ncbi:MAG: hypothetical protein WA672_09775 [Candidatus Angelobacter sp.]
MGKSFVYEVFLRSLDVIRTIYWIKSQIPASVQEIFFSRMLVARHEKIAPEVIFKVTHEMAAVSTIIKRNPDALAVLKAFGLLAMVDPDYISRIASSALSEKGASSREHYEQVVKPWETMMESTVPWQKLTTPAELLQKEMPQDLISIDIRVPEGSVPLPMLLGAVESLGSAYSAMARVYLPDSDAEAKLQILSIQSGSAIRIDCKGLPEVVKHLKEFFLEAWSKVRHKRAEEVIERNSAVLSTLGVLDEIDARKKLGTLGDEEAETLKRTLVDSALGLFSCNAVLAETRPIDIVDNNKLLAQFSPKLLGVGDSQAEAAKKPETSTKTKSKRSSGRGKRGVTRPPSSDSENKPTEPELESDVFMD